MSTSNAYNENPILEAALLHLHRGHQPLPVPFGEKNPGFPGWPQFRCTAEEAARYFPPTKNVGLLLGEPSHGLTEVDIDCQEALIIAPALLPSTRMRSGRQSNPLSHWWYRVTPPDVPMRKFQYALRGSEAETLVEFRATGGQTIIPPSQHPDGEPYIWHEFGDPAEVKAEDLKRIVQKIAVGSLLARFWKAEHIRHDTGLPVAGLFLSCGWDEDEAAELVFLAAQAAGHRDPRDRKQAVHDTFKKASNGQKTTGIPSLAQYMPAEIVDVLVNWCRESSPNPDRGTSRTHTRYQGYEEASGSFGSTFPQESTEKMDWPEPEPLPGGLLPVPEMHEKLIPLPFRPWLVDVADRIQCSLSFPTIGAIIVIAALVGRLLGIRPKRQDDWLVVPNLWGGVIGRPGIMKTPSLAEVMKPLQRLEIDARKNYEDTFKTWEKTKLAREAERAALKHRLTAAAKKGTPVDVESFTLPDTEEGEPIPVRYVVNDSTVEKLGVILNQNPRGVLLFRDELTGWLKTLDREGHEGDRAFYLEAWNGSNSYTYDRIGRGTLHIKAACVSMLGGIQPGPLADYLRAAVRGGAGDDGLVQRFQLLVYPDDPGSWRNVDRWPDTAAKNRAFSLFEKLDTLKPLEIGATAEKGEDIPFLRFTSSGQDLFDQWRTDLEKKIRSREAHPAIEAHLSKYRSLMPSLALLFHLLEAVNGQAEGAVSERAAYMAAAWCDYLEAHARRIYQGVTQHAVFSARRLADRIQESALLSPFTTRDVYRKQWSGLTDPDSVRAATEILEDLNWLRSEKLPTPGRTKLQYHINPAFQGKEKAA